MPTPDDTALKPVAAGPDWVDRTGVVSIPVQPSLNEVQPHVRGNVAAGVDVQRGNLK